MLPESVKYTCSGNIIYSVLNDTLLVVINHNVCYPIIYKSFISLSPMKRESNFRLLLIKLPTSGYMYISIFFGYRTASVIDAQNKFQKKYLKKALTFPFDNLAQDSILSLSLSLSLSLASSIHVSFDFSILLVTTWWLSTPRVLTHERSRPTIQQAQRIDHDHARFARRRDPRKR